MNTNKTLIEKQIEELKRQAEAMERAEIIKQAAEYRGVSEINITPSRAAVNPEKQKYLEYIFTSDDIIFMDTINNPKSAYYNNSQVATVICENESGHKLRVKINMKDVRMNKQGDINTFKVSKKPDSLFYVSYYYEGDFTKGEEAKWVNEVITMEGLIKWVKNAVVSADLFFKKY